MGLDTKYFQCCRSGELRSRTLGFFFQVAEQVVIDRTGVVLPDCSTVLKLVGQDLWYPNVPLVYYL